jgi:hypothetical protein
MRKRGASYCRDSLGGIVCLKMLWRVCLVGDIGVRSCMHAYSLLFFEPHLKLTLAFVLLEVLFCSLTVYCCIL